MACTPMLGIEIHCGVAVRGRSLPRAVGYRCYRGDRHRPGSREAGLVTDRGNGAALVVGASAILRQGARPPTAR